MNYELAKELKEAGFPQSSLSNRTRRRFEEKTSHVLRDDEAPNEYAIPTLEELIEACGSQFDRLKQWKSDGTEWGAYSMSKAHGLGATPKEAVARLWLALNKKV